MADERPKAITEEELSKLKAAETPDAWNAICDRIKTERGGAYPCDWFARVMVSGVLGAAEQRFNKLRRAGAA